MRSPSTSMVNSPLTLNAAYRLFKHYNATLFNGHLPVTELEFSVRLTSTAGLAHTDKPKIVLSTHLLTTLQQFHDTLVHEMIHVYQQYVAQVNERPHGVYFSAWMYVINDVFQWDCGYVRSPEGFKIPCQGQARIRVQVTLQHNYPVEQDAERQSLVGRIKKLLALTESPYEHEAQAALLKAQQLMQSHQVDSAELDQTSEGSELETPLVRELFTQGKRLPAYWQRSLLMVLARYYKCQYVQYSGQGIGVYGHRPYVEITRHLFNYYVQVIDKIAKQHSGHGTVYLNNFRRGMVDRLQTKLAEKQTDPCLSDLAESYDVEQSTDQFPTGLVKLRAEATELKQFIELINPNFYRRPTKRSVVQFDPRAMKKGYESGKVLSVSTPIAAATKKLKPTK